MEIAILGAFDRYNYGDLLFPLILQKYLTIVESVDINFYSLLEGDYLEYNSVISKPFCEFYERQKESDSKNVVIIAGGQMASAKAGRLYSYLRNTPLLNLCSDISKILYLPNPGDILAQKKLKITWGKFPFCPLKPNSKTFLVYNAIGGNSKKIKELAEPLSQADLLSIRDHRFYLKLRNHLNHDKLSLVPDSATVMSKIWPKDLLRKQVSPNAKHLINLYPEGYIVFQAKQKTQRHIKIIKTQLQQLHKKTKLPLLLLPLGRAPRHEDHLFLSQLKDQLNLPSELADISKLHDIMCLIAHSNLFIGTSLHGNITAMSYSIPHLGITNIPKLDQYLKYWDIEPNKTTGTIRPSEIYHASLNVLSDPMKKALSENAERLINLSDESLKQMSNLVQHYIESN